MQKLLVDHGLGRRAQRVARAAAITAATTGLSTDAARDVEPFGFCHYSPAPGCQVAMVNTSATTWVGVAFGSCGRRRGLGINASMP